MLWKYIHSHLGHYLGMLNNKKRVDIGHVAIKACKFAEQDPRGLPVLFPIIQTWNFDRQQGPPNIDANPQSQMRQTQSTHMGHDCGPCNLVALQVGGGPPPVVGPTWVPCWRCNASASGPCSGEHWGPSAQEHAMPPTPCVLLWGNGSGDWGLGSMAWPTRVHHALPGDCVKSSSEIAAGDASYRSIPVCDDRPGQRSETNHRNEQQESIGSSDSKNGSLRIIRRGWVILGRRHGCDLGLWTCRLVDILCFVLTPARRRMDSSRTGRC